MATINLPPVEPKGQKTSEEYLYHVANILAMALEQLQNALEGRLSANNIRAESIETKNLKAGAVTADKITVEELSAISANLGKVIAGILIGAYISTADGTYPRIDFSSQENLLKAMLTATNYIGILPEISGNPSIDFNNGVQRFLMTIISNTLILNAIAGAGNIQLNAQNGDITLNCGSTKKIKVNSWAHFQNVDNGDTLQDVINALQSRLQYLEDNAFVNVSRVGDELEFDSKNINDVESVSIAP